MFRKSEDDLRLFYASFIFEFFCIMLYLECLILFVEVLGMSRVIGGFAEELKLANLKADECRVAILIPENIVAF